MQDQDFGSTQYFKVEKEPENGVKVILAAVYEALTEKGYNPVDQIVGYIMSGDPPISPAIRMPAACSCGRSGTNWWRRCSRNI